MESVGVYRVADALLRKSAYEAPPKIAMRRRHSRRQRAVPQLLRHVGEDFMSGTGDQDVVLNPYASPSGKIHPRLHRHDHARLELRLLALSKPRRLVNL